ncbi:hypothetical protein PybrP1_011790 [[Pythium] brassicae (nom. inval.)]|nr:hypothetical protein PybrP1_011790 [[Pythium] brassicae (nom. inval.)]
MASPAAGTASGGDSAVTSAPPPSSSVLFTPTLLAATTPGGMLSPTNNKRKRIESTRPKPGSAHSGRSRPFSAATAPASGAPKRKGSSDFLRKGQWTVAEEKFARALIEAFQDGYLPIFSGVRLRGYLAVQLQCDPMRISKKLCGGSVDGKQVPRNFGQNKFKLRKKQMWDQAVAARVLAELEQLMHDLWCESGIPRPSYLTLSSTRTPGDDPFFSLGGYVDSVAGPQGAAARVGRSEPLSDCAASSSGSSSPVSRRPLDAPAFPIIYLNLAKKRKKDGDSAARGGCLTVGAPPPTLRATSDGSRAEYKKLAGGAARAAGGWKVDGDSLQAAYELLHLLQAHPDDA